MKFIPLALSLTMFSGLAIAADAQTAPQETTTTTVTTTYSDGKCGSWQGDTWVPNTACIGDGSLRHERMAGTIVSVTGHLVTLQLTDKSIVINDQSALDQHMTGKVAVGRQILAFGYWQGDTFYATALATNHHAGEDASGR